MTFEEVKELIKVVSESNVTDFTYKSQTEGNEFVIKMGKQAGRVVTESCQAETVQPAAAVIQKTPDSQSVYQAVPEETPDSSASCNVVKSPLVGTFYSSAYSGCRTICKGWGRRKERSGSGNYRSHEIDERYRE